jgi:hypothetical protein
MAKPTAKPDLSALTDVLRDLFTTLAAPPPKVKALKPTAEDDTEDETEDDDEDEDDMGMPMPLPPMGKGMRRITISILMPAKGKKTLPRL